MRIKWRATVACDGVDLKNDRYCTETALYETDNPEGTTQEEFGKAALEHFRSVGWRCCEPYPNEKTLCPSCAFNRS